MELYASGGCRDHPLPLVPLTDDALTFQDQKQYYQEQAKLLKDTFNSKYPDYVYRRRPNNSRRRRPTSSNVKTDGLAGEGEDGLSIGEFESPTDGEEHIDESGDSSYGRNSHEPPSYGEIGKYPASATSMSRSATHPFHSAHPLTGYRNPDSRLPYPVPSERISHSLSHRGSNPSLNYGMGSGSSYSNGDVGSGPQSWHGRMERGSIDRGSHSGWSSSQDRSLPSLKDYSRTLPTSSGNWLPSLTQSNSGSHGGSSSHGSNSFATLNSPFYPPASNVSDYSSNSGSGGSQYDSLSLQPIDRSYDRGGGDIDEPLSYTSRGSSRALPPLLPTYPSSNSAPSTSAPSMGSPNFWPRNP